MYLASNKQTKNASSIQKHDKMPTSNWRRSAHVPQLRRERHKVIVERVAAVRLQAGDRTDDGDQRHLDGQRILGDATRPAAPLGRAAVAARIAGRIAGGRTATRAAAIQLLLLMPRAQQFRGAADGGHTAAAAIRAVASRRRRWAALAPAVGRTLAGAALAAARRP